MLGYIPVINKLNIDSVMKKEFHPFTNRNYYHNKLGINYKNSLKVRLVQAFALLNKYDIFL